jgi:hypothetical protein
MPHRFVQSSSAPAAAEDAHRAGAEGFRTAARRGRATRADSSAVTRPMTSGVTSAVTMAGRARPMHVRRRRALPAPRVERLALGTA